MSRGLTAIIECDGDAQMERFPEVAIASRRATVTAAHANRQEMREPFLETASRAQIERRFRSEAYVKKVGVSAGSASSRCERWVARL